MYRQNLIPFENRYFHDNYDVLPIFGYFGVTIFYFLTNNTFIYRSKHRFNDNAVYVYFCVSFANENAYFYTSLNNY